MKRTSKLALGIAGGVIGIGIISSALNGGNPSETTILTTTTIIESTIETTDKALETTIETTQDETTEETTQASTTEATTTKQTTKATTSATTKASAKETTVAYKLSLISMTTPISPGEIATIEISGKPNIEYDINVYYSSGKSSADGLENKTSNETGYVTWTWKVGSGTNPGDYHIDIKGGSKTLRVNFTVK